MKRLYRNRDDEMIAGVCSGIAEYLGVDPTAIRLAFVLFAFLGGSGVPIYLVLWIIMPVKGGEKVEKGEAAAKSDSKKIAAKTAEEKAAPASKPAAKTTTVKKTPAKKPAATKKTTVTKKPAAKKAPAKKPPAKPSSEESSG